MQHLLVAQGKCHTLSNLSLRHCFPVHLEESHWLVRHFQVDVALLNLLHHPHQYWHPLVLLANSIRYPESHYRGYCYRQGDVARRELWYLLDPSIRISPNHGANMRQFLLEHIRTERHELILTRKRPPVQFSRAPIDGDLRSERQNA